MAGILGILGTDDTERGFVTRIGQSVIYEAANLYAAQVNAAMELSMSSFVDMTTTDHVQRFKLPGSGYMQEHAGYSNPSAVKASGSWDVAYPLKDFRRDVGWTDIDLGYMTAEEFENHITTVVNQNATTTRLEILQALMLSSNYTWTDKDFGDLTIRRLANNDGTNYPPVLGAVDDTQNENHYITSGYTAANISDSSDPFPTLVDELEEHFGTVTGGSDIVVFVNNAQRAKIEDLTDFVPVTDNFVIPGQDTDTVTGMPMLPRYARVLGRHTSGATVVEWRFIPANYMLAIHMEAPKPLKRRVDPADTGLTAGLQLITTDETQPLSRSTWRNRQGFGVGNRLNGVAMELTTDATYDDPTLV